MSSRNAAWSLLRCSVPRCGRCAGRPSPSSAMNGGCSRRHTSGGTNWPSVAPARTTGPSTRGRQPGCTKLRELSRGIASTRPSRMPRKRLTRSTVGRRVVDQVAIAHHQHPLGIDVAVEVAQLVAVQPELAVAPERRPACADPVVLQRERRLEVGHRLEAVGPQVHPVAVGAVDRVADHGDQLDVGECLRDAAVRAAAPEVERRALPADLLVASRGEEREVVGRRARSTPAASACRPGRPRRAEERRRRARTSAPSARTRTRRDAGPARRAARSCRPWGRRSPGSRDGVLGAWSLPELGEVV